MDSREQSVEAVVKAVTSGKATSSTSVTLRTLLNPKPKVERDQAGRSTNVNSKIRTSKTVQKTVGAVRSTAKGAAKEQAFDVHEDESTALSDKAKQALATSVVNAGLKILSQAVRAQPRASQRKQALQVSETPKKTTAANKRPLQYSPTHPGALQPRSGNATPTPRTQKTVVIPQGSSPASPSPCRDEPNKRSIQTGAVAECTSHAFHHLLSSEMEGVEKDLSKALQLEKGMLAFCSKLVDLNLHQLAMKEMRAVKRRLETRAAPTKARKASKITTDTAINATSEQSTLSNLLELSLDDRADLDTLSLGTTHQLNVLRCISNRRNPATLMSALQYLMIASSGGPVDMIQRCAALSGDTTKAARQLDVLSQLVLSLCPSISSSKDEVASDPTQYPSPHLVFRLQSVALQIQSVSNRLTSESRLSSHSMVGLFSKFLTAYLRRSRRSAEDKETYTNAVTAYHELRLSKIDSSTLGSDSLAPFKIHRSLCILAEAGELHDEATYWAEELIKSSETLEDNHALRSAAKARRLTAWVRRVSPEERNQEMNNEITGLRLSLERPLTGVTSDLEILLVEISHFMDCLIRESRSGELSSSHGELFGVAARLVARYNRLHPGIGEKHAVSIVDSAVSACRSIDELASWVTKDAFQVMNYPGDVCEILEMTSYSSLSRTWSSSRSALVLSRMLKGLMHKAVRSDPDTAATLIFDDASLQYEQRGALLEWQFMQAIGHFRKKQYQSSGQRLVPELLERLDGCYKASKFPLRRARVAIHILRKAQECPEIIPASVLDQWRNCQLVDQKQLEKDHGLSHFVMDVNVSLQVAKAFIDGYPEPVSLSPFIASWLSLLHIPDNGDIFQLMDDPADSLAQLKGLDDYLAMLGDHQERIQLAQVLLLISKLLGQDNLERCGTMLTLVRVYLEIGHTDNAKRTLLQVEQYLKSGNESKLRSLQYEACRSEYLFAIDDTLNCREALGKAKHLCKEIQKRDSTTYLTKRFRLLTSQIALVESKLQLTTGSSHDALRTAKEVAKHLNVIWSSSERSIRQSEHELEESDVEDDEKGVQGLTKGISKLNLKAKSALGKDRCPESTIKGVAFWPLVPILCEAFSHLSNVLAHHGIFRDAIYCSNQAVKVADTREFSSLRMHMLIRRSELYTAAGKLEAAELDLTTTAEKISSGSLLTRVHLLRAQAGLRLKEGLWDQASALYDEAERMLQTIQSELYLLKPEALELCKHDLVSREEKADTSITRSAHSRKEPGARTTASKSISSRSKSKLPSTTAAPGEAQSSCSYTLRKMQAHILLDKTLTAFKMGGHVAAYIIQLQNLFSSLPGTSSQRQVEFHGMMRKVATALQRDVSFNVLPESTLAVPALMGPTMLAPELTSKKTSTTSRSQKKSTRAAVSSSRKTDIVPAEALESLLADAAGCLTVAGSCIRTTAETHLELAMVSSAAMLLSATCLSSASSLRLPVESALTIELPRINATECSLASAKVEIELHGSKSLHDVTSVTESGTRSALTGAEFQEQFINILPKPWTVVSLSLSEDAEELYISRYRHGSSPLILRLPFARHKPDSEDDEPFDFETGKAELQDIIELNNYTCHQPVDTKNKTARDKWWVEREALDRRLEELLINMENIWLGGFRGMFSQQRSDPGLLQQFRTAFESTLERHLPSRNGVKRNSNRLVISDAILELFTGLDINGESGMDVDEALADLLYFVVDMFQFNGERNAYDEVDFDTMSVEVFDALQVYHRGTDDDDNTGNHTILVIDKRLQAFPWESLPCLDGSSVSRVDSMLTLRERVSEMQEQKHLDRGCPDGYYSVPRNSGSYILNPSGDLKNTEESLGPMLSTLRDSKESCWSSMVKRGPTEEEVKAMLDTGSTLLYFGHGAATQYIRPRAIRQLSRCSEVVWLMGCSSGSVTEHDELEPSAVPYEYMVAGQARETSSQHEDSDNSERAVSRRCMAVLAMLWDVTDKDIDRFSLAVGNEWGLWRCSPSQSKLPAKTPRKREVGDIPSTPRQGPKTPKTPRVRNTPAPARTPARSRSRAGRDREQKSSLVDAVARSRDVCYLRYLNGAAPVVYGIPVYLQD